MQLMLSALLTYFTCSHTSCTCIYKIYTCTFDKLVKAQTRPVYKILLQQLQKIVEVSKIIMALDIHGFGRLRSWYGYRCTSKYGYKFPIERDRLIAIVFLWWLYIIIYNIYTVPIII